jgi:hypothetical protein
MRRPELQNKSANSDLLTFIFNELNEEKSKITANNGYLISLYEVVYRMIKECPKALCCELFGEIEEFLVDDVRVKTKNESFTTHERKMRAYIGLFEKVLNINTIRIRYSRQKKEIMEGIGPGMEVPMITDQNSRKMREERQKKKEEENPKQQVEKTQNVTLERDLETSEYDINIRFIDQLEDFVDVMFDHLGSSSYSVRSLAGRGLALVVSKLSNEMVRDVLDSLILLVEEDEEESEQLLHGVCLSLGELASVGLILPKMLPDIIKILKKALLFENIKGNHASGNIVRDSGCYISWAFARGFDSEDLAPFVNELANELLLVALFDNQGNCRRAAAAAFQENVGRQGNFPNGIEIISEMDFFSVGLSTNSFTKIAPFVASFQQYTHRFMDHLAFNRLCHLSQETRLLSANSLALIALFDPQYVVDKIIPALIKRAESRILSFRHGALLGLGFILTSFSGNIDRKRIDPSQKDSIFIKTLNINEKKLISEGEYMEGFMKNFRVTKKQNILHKIQKPQIEGIINILGRIKTKNMLKGIGGELTKLGLCFLSESLALAKIPLPHDKVLEYMEFFEQCIRMTIEQVQLQAPESLNIFCKEYMTDATKLDLVEISKGFQCRFNKEITKHGKVSYANGISALSKEMLVIMKDGLISDLLSNAKINKKIRNNDPEIRKASLRTLFKIIEKTRVVTLTMEQVQVIFETLSLTIRDYTLDNRGDIGCIVREETMSVYIDLLHLMINEKQHIQKDPSAKEDLEKINLIMSNLDLASIISNILTQILQPNDRLRLRAGYVMQILTDQILPSLPTFKDRDMINDLFLNKALRLKFKEFQDQFFDNYDVSLLDDKKFLAYNLNSDFVYFWNIPQCAYPYLSPLLRSDVFRQGILVGYLLSTSNTLEEKMIQYSMTAIEDFLSENGDNPLVVAQTSLKILSQHKKKEKFTICVFNVMKVIFENYITQFEGQFEKLALRLFRAIEVETRKTSSIQKLVHAGSLLTILLSAFENLTPELYMQKIKPMLPRFLFSEFPIVRKAFSEEFYMFLITKGDELFDSDMLETASEMLMSLTFDDILTEEHETFKSVWDLMNEANEPIQEE